MTRKIIVLICLAIFTDYVCRAQTNSDSQTNLEESVSGVHLTITLSNNVIDAGSITIKAAIQNRSTNIIRLVEFPATTDFDVLLINGSGKSFKLTPPRPLGGSRVPIMLKPEERRDWVIPIAVGNELKPGEYVMKASRNFNANGKWFVMHSNSLKVSIK